MSEKKKNLCAGILMLLFAIFIYVGSFWIPETKSDILGSRFFPRCAAILMGILSTILTLTSLPPDKAAEDVAKEKRSIKWNVPLILTCTALLLYYIIIIQFGFVITSILYLFCQCLILLPKEDYQDRKKMAVTLIVSIIIPIAINFIFWKVFSIALPAGKLF